MTPEPRLAKFLPEEFTTEQRQLYDTIAGGKRAAGPRHFQLVDADGGLEGPFNALLVQPALGDAVQALGAAIRFATTLSDRHREIAILMVATAEESAFERYAHEPIGVAAGLTSTEIAALRGADPTSGADFDGAGDRELIAFCSAILQTGNAEDQTFAAATTSLSQQGVFELLTLIGYYRMLALQMRVYDVKIPPEPAT